MEQPTVSVYLCVGAGCGLGGILRFWISAAIGSRFPYFPVATLTVNVIGSLLVGALGAYLILVKPGIWSPRTVNFAIAGFLGGFTTFSTFSWQTLELCREGSWWAAAANVLLSVLLCLAAVVAGFFTVFLLRK